MSFIARWLGAVPAHERQGIRLEDAEPWRVGATKDAERFLVALPILVPEGAIAYFEATGEPHVAEYLQRVSVPPQTRLAVGTIWPKPDIHHVPVTADSMQALIRFLEQQPTGYFCSHCHVYRDGLVLLQWYDAFTDDPMYISRTIPAEAVTAFARALGSECAEGWG